MESTHLLCKELSKDYIVTLQYYRGRVVSVSVKGSSKKFPITVSASLLSEGLVGAKIYNSYQASNFSQVDDVREMNKVSEDMIAIYNRLKSAMESDLVRKEYCNE